MDKIKEKELDRHIRLRNLTTEEAVDILDQGDYLDENDKNIEDLDMALWEACISGEVKNISEIDEITKYLVKKGLIKESPHSSELSLMLAMRALSGHSSLVIEKVLGLGGQRLVENATKKIDKILNEGGDYKKVFESVVYCDCPPENLAFLDHVEKRFQTTVLSPNQLSSLADLKDEPQDDVENCFFMALEYRYNLALKGILKKGGSFTELMAVDPKSFNLPDQWDGMNEGMNKEKMIDKTIFFYFSLDETIDRRPHFRDIADEIGAPYERILKIFSEWSI